GREVIFKTTDLFLVCPFTILLQLKILTISNFSCISVILAIKSLHTRRTRNADMYSRMLPTIKIFFYLYGYMNFE
ncbi:MAG: hypothetical protein CVV34_06650, partial [Methanomicrobiales archaeon HGW-Methanomicrobiales-5]